jgi:hypothetical protein
LSLLLIGHACQTVDAGNPQPVVGEVAMNLIKVIYSDTTRDARRFQYPIEHVLAQHGLLERPRNCIRTLEGNHNDRT